MLPQISLVTQLALVRFDGLYYIKQQDDYYLPEVSLYALKHFGSSDYVARCTGCCQPSRPATRSCCHVGQIHRRARQQRQHVGVSALWLLEAQSEGVEYRLTYGVDEGKGEGKIANKK